MTFETGFMLLVFLGFEISPSCENRITRVGNSNMRNISHILTLESPFKQSDLKNKRLVAFLNKLSQENYYFLNIQWNYQ